MTVIIVILIVAIIFSLASSLRYMLKGNDVSTKMVKALTLRIGLSLLLFILLIVSFWMGWIQPHQARF